MIDVKELRIGNKIRMFYTEILIPIELTVLRIDDEKNIRI